MRTWRKSSMSRNRNGTLVGVIVQYGGQTPLKLAHGLASRQARRSSARRSIPSISPRTATASSACSTSSALKQPKNGIAYSVEQSRIVAGELGLPLVVRPSYVLGGRAMAIIRDQNELDDYLLGTLPSLVPVRDQGALSQRQDRADQYGARQEPAAVRPLSHRRDRDRRRLPRRRRDGRHRRRHGAYRGGRHSFRRFGLLAAAALAVAGNDRRAGEADQEPRHGARRRRADECAIRAQGRRDLCARSQSARLAHRALRRQGRRRAHRQDRRARHGGREAFDLRPAERADRITSA